MMRPSLLGNSHSPFSGKANVFICCLFVVLLSLSAGAQTSSAPPVVASNGTSARRALLDLYQNQSQSRFRTLEEGVAAHQGLEAVVPMATPQSATSAGITFAPPYAAGTDLPPAVVAELNGAVAADVNGDGIPDLISWSGQAVTVQLGNGDGTFQPAMNFAVSGFSSVLSIAVADVNGDGKPDIILGGSNDIGAPAYDAASVCVLLLGNGDGTFQPAIPVTGTGGGDGVMSIAVADVNGDGKPDLVLANECPAQGCQIVYVPDVAVSWQDGAVGVWLGNGDGTFQPAVSYDSGGQVPTSLAVADLNGDGKLDIVVANFCPYDPGNHGFACQIGLYSTVGELLGNGDGTFQPVQMSGSGGYYTDSLAIADFDGDGTADVAVGSREDKWPDQSTGSVEVLVFNGGGGFQATVPNVNAGELSVAEAYLNGDGKPDLVAGDGTGAYIFINTTPGPTTTALAASVNPSTSGQPLTLAAKMTPQGFKAIPTGTVAFDDGTVQIADLALDGTGRAALTTSSLAVGTHTITATYSGDGNYAASTASITEVIGLGCQFTVTSTVAPSSTTLANMPATAYYGDSVTISGCTYGTSHLTYALVGTGLKSTLSAGTVTFRATESLAVQISAAAKPGYPAVSWTTATTTVAPRPLSVQANSPSWTYGVLPTGAQAITLSIAAGSPPLAFPADQLPTSGDYSLTNASSTDVTATPANQLPIGRYTITPTAAKIQAGTKLEYYVITPVTGTLTVAPNNASGSSAKVKPGVTTVSLTGIEVGTSGSAMVLVHNTTGETLNITASLPTGTPWSVTPASGCAATVTNSACQLTLTFASTAAGATTSTLSISAVDANADHVSLPRPTRWRR